MEASHKNLKLLWWLRNLAIIGQVTAVTVAYAHFKLTLPYDKLLGIVALLSLVNFFTYLRLISKPLISNFEFFCQLLADIFVLTALLYFTGGASNPFATLFVLQVMIAATILSPAYSWAVSLVTIVIYTALLRDSTGMAGMMDADFKTHIHGMWVNFIILVILVNWFVARMNVTLRKKDALLAENEKMASLASLAVSAAHQLGTPLGTIGLVGESLSKVDGVKAGVIAEQVARCKNIITEITKISGAAKAESGKAMMLAEFVKLILAEWKKPAVGLHDVTDYNKLTQNIFADNGLKTAVINILDNAYDASPEFLELNCFIKSAKFFVRISDHGKGIEKVDLGNSTKQTGLGMGLYLSQSIIARLGGKLEIARVKTGGTKVEISLPLERIKL